MALHFICGTAGSGKTTLAREVGYRLPAAVFCEDEWIATLGFEMRTVEHYTAASKRCRGLMASLAVPLLRMNVSVVFDVGGNIARARAYAREVFEAENAEHVLHVIPASDEWCLSNIHRRNEEKPPGIYWGERE